MSESDTAYLQRDRAESFGAVAELYDRYRPGYPDALIADLVELAAGGPVLDIGTGTGKAGAALVRAGLTVLGVEVDGQMARVARGHGLEVEVSSFESWADRGRRFGLAVSAQAWHWVDPAQGAPKVARLLEPGRTFAPFWNYQDLDDQTRDTVVAVYREHAPEVADSYAMRGDPSQRPFLDDLRRSGAFASLDTHVYRWSDTIPVESWVGRVGTHSNHLKLGPERLRVLQDALVEALAGLGPQVTLTGGTYLVRARVV